MVIIDFGTSGLLEKATELAELLLQNMQRQKTSRKASFNQMQQK
jgi:thiamine kinase-like enzyme